ncbi:peptide ABC transporter substrate-binding protein [Roseateles toxinivorans]|uniref:Peptide/nickel transport system substrate-binding protein n=1 Tax=Roseateles toxinivorans TaxID=270368 RepID=A0A4R6QLY5_9BURK|nr:peptide ABC transporter substrate-binding protein [Roseateles toxinivorans]TDP63878.1 peptide/nickel transport system substrate-binding protein [Roseateles toxinivorans]
MQEQALRTLIEDVREGRLARRAFVQRMLALGLTAPMAGQMLMHAGIAQAQAPSGYKPTKRGGGGALKLLWWQGATLLNPHFATGTKDQEGARIFYEPLAAWNADGDLVPILAAEIPSVQNGGLSKDGMSVTWKLKRGATWHDGKPFTADDCVFNWEYASHPDTAAVTVGTYKDCKVEKIDSHTVKVTFKKPTPFWADPFVGTRGMLIPKHLFADFIGAKSRDAPANLKPVGTGPYKFVDFKPGDMVRGAINTSYHFDNRPFFDTIEMKGGGDAVSAARAVIQTGEFDYAWNMQVEDEILKRLEAGGRGKVTITPGGNIEFIVLNMADPWTEVDGERAHPKSRHPIMSDQAVRQALNLLVDRGAVQEFIYGRTGVATANFLNNPERFRSKTMKWEFNVDKASAVLEAAGWKKGNDGIREKGGKKLKLVFQTSINAPRQKTQAIIKQAAQKAGVDLELKAITSSVYFSSDVGNPDTYTKFFCDVEMYTTTMTQPDAELFMNQFVSWEFSTKENKWQGRNIARWKNDEYDKAFRAAENELDPVKRAALFIRMNDLICSDPVVIPVVYRPRVAAVASKLYAPLSGWDNDLWNLKDWFREA